MVLKLHYNKKRYQQENGRLKLFPKSLLGHQEIGIF